MYNNSPTTKAKDIVWIWFTIPSWLREESIGIEKMRVSVNIFVHAHAPITTKSAVVLGNLHDIRTYFTLPITTAPLGINIPRYSSSATDR